MTPTQPPERKLLHDPWLFDTQALIAELDRIRELNLRVPRVRNDQCAPWQSVTDALWRLRETLRELINVHSDAQTAFRAKALPQQSPNRQTPTRRRQAGARTANAHAGH
jgi:hypothetical protein